jgi:hypothetical protein
MFRPRRGDGQKEFNTAMEDLNAQLALGNECDIVLETITGRNMLLVEGYFDIEANKEGFSTASRIWYNKKFLTDLNIKY